MKKIKMLECIKTSKIGIEIKMLLNCILVGGIICLILSGATYRIVSRYLTESTKRTVITMAEIAAVETDGDLFETLHPGDETTDVYISMQEQMFKFFNYENIAYVYSLKPLNEEEVQFIVAADPAGDPYHIGQPYEQLEEMQAAFKGDATITEQPVEDEWGVFYTAYAPIYNKAEEVVGIVGVDCEKASLQRQINALTLRLIALGAVCITLGIAGNVASARRIGKKIFISNQMLMHAVCDEDDLMKKAEADKEKKA